MLDILKHFIQPDIAVAMALAAIALFVFFAVRVGALPKKGVPWVVGGLLAAVGIGLWRERRASELQKVIKQKEKELKKRTEHLEVMKKEFELSDEEANAAVARRDAEIQSLTEEVIAIRKHTDEELKNFQEMTPQQRREFVLNMNVEN